MESTHDGMHIINTGHLLGILHRIDNAGMGTTGKHHQSFALDIECQSGVVVKRIRHFLTVNLAAQVGRTFFIRGDPFDLAKKKGLAV